MGRNTKANLPKSEFFYFNEEEKNYKPLVQQGAIPVVIIGGEVGNSRNVEYRYGEGDPSDNLGSEGDWYLDTVSGDLFHKEESWVFIMKLKGEDGSPGPKGDPGDPIEGEGQTIIVAENLQELQNRYPEGIDTPAWVKEDNSWYYWKGEEDDTGNQDSDDEDDTETIEAPKEIDNLYAWFDASQLTYANEESIEQWNDLSGNERHGIEGNNTLPVKDDTGLNGLPSVRFTGSGVGLDVIDGLPTGDNGNFTVFTVFKQEASGGYQNLYSTYDNEDGVFIWVFPNRFELAMFNSSRHTILASAPTNVTHNKTYLGYVSFDTTVGIAKAGLNGETPTENPTSLRSSTSTMNIGSHNSNNNQNDTSLKGVISEIIIYDRVLNEEEKEQIENYLSDKWNISL